MGSLETGRELFFMLDLILCALMKSYVDEHAFFRSAQNYITNSSWR